MTDEQIRERLAELNQKMTPAPWKPCERESESPYFWGPSGDSLGTAFWPIHDNTPEATRQAETQTYDNVEGICELRNSIINIVDALLAAEAKLENAEQAALAQVTYCREKAKAEGANERGSSYWAAGTLTAQIIANAIHAMKPISPPNESEGK